MMSNFRWFAALVIGLVAAIGCGETIDDDPSPDDATERTGVALTVDFHGGTDVAGFEYQIRECGEERAVKSAIVDLEDLVLPGMIPNFDNDPFDERSRHLFSDYFTVLPAGCYDIEVHPVDDHGERSEQCSAASASGVNVEPKKTTELLLISQCEGEDRGAIDVVAAMNHPPRIASLHFPKFRLECEKIEICATATDPDGDPLELEWTQVDGPPLKKEIQIGDAHKKPCEMCDYLNKEVPQRDEYEGIHFGGEAEECIALTLGRAGDYEFRVAAYDLYWDGDQLARFDDSSAGLTFPVYAGEKSSAKCPEKEKNLTLPPKKRLKLQ